MGNGAGGLPGEEPMFEWPAGRRYPDADAAVTDVRILAARNARRPLTEAEVNELVRAWRALDAMLCAGEGLPEPWEQQRSRRAVRGQDVVAPNPDLL